MASEAAGPEAALLPGGRLHLQHGPIDLVIGADGPGQAEAFRAARARFGDILQGLVDELPRLRAPAGPPPMGPVTRRMAAAVAPFAGIFVTPMAAVAGAVADEVLAAMPCERLRRAYVNNGGDIACWLAPGEAMTGAIAGTGPGARLVLTRPGGVATSGAGGRSLSRGIAGAVSVIADTAAAADAAATLIANRVDLPGHPGIARLPARAVQPDSDLGDRLVVQSVPRLAAEEIAAALDTGVRVAAGFAARGLVAAVRLELQGAVRVVDPAGMLGRGQRKEEERQDA